MEAEKAAGKQKGSDLALFSDGNLKEEAGDRVPAIEIL